MWNIGGLACRLGQMDGTIKVSDRAGSGRAAAGGLGSGAGVPEDVAALLPSAPRLAPLPPAPGWRISLAWVTRPARRRERSSPLPSPRSGARLPPSALPACQPGRRETRGPRAQIDSGGRRRWVHHSHRQAGLPGPGAGHSPAGRLPLARGRRLRGPELQSPPARVPARWALGRASGLVAGGSGSKCVWGSVWGFL